MANPSDPRTGTVYTQQIRLTNPATQDFHAVRSDDPRLLHATQDNIPNGYGPEMFGNGDPLSNGDANIPDGSAVFIGDDGKLAVAHSILGAQEVFAIKSGGKYFFHGMYVKNYGTGLVPGNIYWLQALGAPGQTAPTQAGEYATRVIIAMTATNALVHIEVQGQN